jgi:hypothetical protein
MDTALLDSVDVIVDFTPANPKGSCEIVKRAAPRKREDRTENSRESPKEDSQQG